MGIAQIPAPATPSVPNWTFVTSSAPTGVSTVTFSGLSGYSKYRILAPNLVPSGVANFQFRLNADSGSNYNTNLAGWSGGTASTSGNTPTTQGMISFGSLTSAWSFQLDIDHALLATPKFISGYSQNATNTVWNILGTYITTSAITSITLLTSANNFSTGTIYLLGAN